MLFREDAGGRVGWRRRSWGRGVPAITWGVGTDRVKEEGFRRETGQSLAEA